MSPLDHTTSNVISECEKHRFTLYLDNSNGIVETLKLLVRLAYSLCLTMHFKPKPGPPCQVSSRSCASSVLRHGFKGPHTCTRLSHGPALHDSKLIKLNGCGSCTIKSVPLIDILLQTSAFDNCQLSPQATKKPSPPLCVCPRHVVDSKSKAMLTNM